MQHSFKHVMDSLGLFHSWPMPDPACFIAESDLRKHKPKHVAHLGLRNSVGRLGSYAAKSILTACLSHTCQWALPNRTKQAIVV